MFEILAPSGITRQISLWMKKNIWQGGKPNTKKLHFVKRSTVTSLKENEGIVIRDPIIMNKALGTKTLWRVSSKKAWWKPVLHKKYLSLDHLRWLKP